MDRSMLSSDVVVVDDDPRVRALTLHILEKAGLTVSSHDSPLAALDLVLAHPPRVLLTDFSMPELDGVALASAVRGGLGERCPRIMLLTGNPQSVRARDKHLFDVILGKPWESHVLVDTVLPWVRASIPPLAAAG
jgi:CheY-like chemotaxis protein